MLEKRSPRRHRKKIERIDWEELAQAPNLGGMLSFLERPAEGARRKPAAPVAGLEHRRVFPGSEQEARTFGLEDQLVELRERRAEALADRAIEYGRDDLRLFEQPQDGPMLRSDPQEGAGRHVFHHQQAVDHGGHPELRREHQGLR